MGLSELRAEIDKIDREIIGLLCQRFEIVKGISHLKRGEGIDIEDVDREEDILKNSLEKSRGKLNPTFLEELMKLIISESKKIQEKAK
ncbi:MAG: chorismate mutase [Candidatus Hydrothermarchaeaceae archaeon]